MYTFVFIFCIVLINLIIIGIGTSGHLPFLYAKAPNSAPPLASGGGQKPKPKPTPTTTGSGGQKPKPKPTPTATGATGGGGQKPPKSTPTATGSGGQKPKPTPTATGSGASSRRVTSDSTMFIGKAPPPAAQRDPKSVYVKDPISGMVISQTVSTGKAQYQGASVPVLTVGGASAVIVNGKPVYGSIKNGVFTPGGSDNTGLQQVLTGKAPPVMGSQAGKDVAGFVTGPQVVSWQNESHVVQQAGPAKTNSGQQIQTTVIDGKTYANIGGKLHEGTVSNGTFTSTGQVNNQGQVVDAKGRPARGAKSEFLATLATAAATGGAIGASMGGPLGAALGAVIGTGGGALASLLTGSGKAPTSGTKPLPTQTTVITDAKGKSYVYDPKKGTMVSCSQPTMRSDNNGFSFRVLSGGGCPTTGPRASVYDLNAAANERLQALNPQFEPLDSDHPPLTRLPPAPHAAAQGAAIAAASAQANRDHPALTRLPPSRPVEQQNAERQAAMAAQQAAERQTTLNIQQQNALTTALTRGYSASQYMASGNVPPGFTAREYDRLRAEYENAGDIYIAMSPTVQQTRSELQNAKTIFDVANTQYRNALNLVQRYGNNVPVDVANQTRTLYNQAANAWVQVTRAQNDYSYNLGYLQHIATLGTLGFNENTQRDWNEYTLTIYGNVNPSIPSTLTAPPSYQSRTQYTIPPPLPPSVPPVYPREKPSSYDDSTTQIFM